MDIGKKILLEENELKPNKYAANTMMVSAVLFAAVEVINEIGIFHVEVGKMRFTCALMILCAALVKALTRNRATAQKRSTKFHVLGIVHIETLLMTIVISQWTEMVIVLPLFVALAYHDKDVTLFTIVGTLVIALISRPLSVLLELQQVDFYEFLVRSVGYKATEIIQAENYNKAYYIGEVFKYISIPRVIIIAALSPLAVYITELASHNIQDRVDATYYSSTDVMTGIYNRFSFEEKLREYQAERPKRLFCVYADADGLHELNNTQGHEAGDALLKFCATQMAETFGKWTYRLGGDEFLSFVEDAEEDEMAAHLVKIRTSLKHSDYHMSIGIAVLENGKTIDELVREAESEMFASKSRYYVETGKDRRKKR